MVALTESLRQFLMKNYKDKLSLILLGHVELITDEMQQEYFEWLNTDEGKSYLQGGSNYREPN